MSPFADCPIVEVRPDPDFGLVAVVPLLQGDRAVCAATHTLAGLLAFAETRPANVVHYVDPRFDPRQTDDQVDLYRIIASTFYRHQLARRGRRCEKCGTPT